MSQPEGGNGAEDGAPFISHLVELRTRLIRILIAVLIIFIPLGIYAQELFDLLTGPFLAQLPQGAKMLATEPVAPFLTPFKFALVTAFFLAVPVILWQLWAFIAPGLYQHEKRFAMPLAVLSAVLFYAGVAFAYFVVLKLIFGFIVNVAPVNVEVQPDITRYLEFVLTLFFAFGMAFEIPVATVLIVRAGITTPGALAEKRPYVLVGAFVVGMLLTPPDAISQTLLALPTYALFELGILLSRVLVPGAREVDEQRRQRGS